MKSLKAVIFILLSILSSTIARTSFAYTPKEGNVTATLGPYIYRTHFNHPGSTVKVPYMGGWSLMANGDFSDKESLEIALFNFHKRFFREQDSNFVGEESELISLTMGYRRWLNPYFSWSVGIYSSYTMGVPAVVHNDFAPDRPIDTSARDITEYGVDFSLQSELWSKDRLGLIADLRYSSSLTSRVGEQGNHYGVMVGIKYFIQGKDRDPDPTPFNNPENPPSTND